MRENNRAACVSRTQVFYFAALLPASKELLTKLMSWQWAHTTDRIVDCLHLRQKRFYLIIHLLAT